MALQFHCATSKDGQFYFTLKDGDTALLRSERYTTKAACDNGIASVQKNASEDKRYQLEQATNGKYYFNLKAGNGQVIGTSPMYGSEGERQQAISACHNAAQATVHEA